MSAIIELHELPKCSCGGTIVPLTDEGRPGQNAPSSVSILKAWICFNCHKNVTIRNGELQIVPPESIASPKTGTR